MSKLIRIATIGPRPLHVAENTPPQIIVQLMIDHWRSRLNQVFPDNPDLIVVPEVCDRPDNLTLDQLLDYYNVREHKLYKFFSEAAKEHHSYILYSSVHKHKDGSRRNSSFLIDWNGETVGIYNKNHVVIEETSEVSVLCGRESPVFKCDFGRVACAICFDLNFDELRLRYVKQKPDLILFSSMYHGGLMQAYWAYSCRSYFVGAIAGLPSEIRNPFGEIIASSTNYHDFAVADVNLDYCLAHLDGNWEKLTKLKAAYGPQVLIHDPAYIGSVLITSFHEKVSAMDMTKEFEIELLDDYLHRAISHHHKDGNMES
jgi:hypothetical protein